MPTKAELQAQVQTLESQLAAVRKGRERERQRIVDTAMKQAKRYGWCDVVRHTLRSMGYGDYLPHQFVIERREPGYRWQQYGAARNSALDAKRFNGWRYVLNSLRSSDFRLVERNGSGQIVKVHEQVVR